MVVFIDTSSLIKRYIEEKGSSKVDFYYKNGNEIFISPVTPIEFRSALKRKLKEKTINLESYYKALDGWSKEESNYKIVVFNHILVIEAIQLIEEEFIKTLDSIQLASAKMGNFDEFITSDKQLFNIASKNLKYKVSFI